MSRAEDRVEQRTPMWVKVGLGLGVLGLILWLVRWAVQGADTIYTDTARAFWVPGTRQGMWLETTDRWVWLGLEGLGVFVAVVLGTLVMVWLGGRAQKPGLKGVATALSRVGAVVLVAAPVLPVWALVTGMPPSGAQRLRPLSAPTRVEAAPADELAVSPGKWVLLETSHNLVSARITAGGETFDAKFAPITAQVEVAAKLSASKATFSVPASSVATGVELRNSHAQDYLSASTHPTITVAIGSLRHLAAGTDAYSRSFLTEGEVTLMGKTLRLLVQGHLGLLSDDDRAELGIAAPTALMVDASFTLPVKETPLDPGNFDVEELPLTARLVLVPAP